MARILAIDYGTKRVGVAVTDELQIIASGLATIKAHEIVAFLVDYMSKNEVETIVVGEPKGLDNNETDSSEAIHNFVRHITKKFKTVKIERMDERFTSKLAMKSLVESGVKKSKRREKGLLDEVSATIILQDYLSRKSNGF